MSKRSGIEWTEYVWNILFGCSRASTGCQGCYAERLAYRFSNPGHPFEGLIHPVTHGWNGTVRFKTEALDQPIRWRRGRTIFVNSMSDTFHESVSNEDIAAIFGVMAASPHHLFQVLTKRAERMAEWFEWHREQLWKTGTLDQPWWVCIQAAERYLPNITRQPFAKVWPLPNVHLAVSAENQEQLDRRVIHLLKCPAAVHWLSCEPLLGPMDLLATPAGDILSRKQGRPRIDGIVAGGESGPGARQMHAQWPRVLRDQCKDHDVAFFFKQWGEWAPAPQLDGVAQAHHRRALWDGSAWHQIGKSEIDVITDDLMIRVGKKAADRFLDGQEHLEWPEPEPIVQAA